MTIQLQHGHCDCKQVKSHMTEVMTTFGVKKEWVYKPAPEVDQPMLTFVPSLDPRYWVATCPKKECRKVHTRRVQ